MNTIYILWLRRIKVYSRSRTRIIASLGQPVLFLLALGFGLGPMYEKAGGGDYLQFIAPGVICMGILFIGMFSGLEIIWERQFGFLKETLVAPVPRSHIMIGRTLGGATIALIQGTLIFVISMIAGFRPESLAMVPAAFAIMFLVALLFTAFGTALGCVLKDFQAFQVIMNLLIMPLFFLSGALFPLTDLPLVIAALTRINPLSYGVDALRGALVNASHFGLGVDLFVLTVVTLLCLLVGSYLFSKIEV